MYLRCITGNEWFLAVGWWLYFNNVNISNRQTELLRCSKGVSHTGEFSIVYLTHGSGYPGSYVQVENVLIDSFSSTHTLCESRCLHEATHHGTSVLVMRIDITYTGCSQVKAEWHHEASRSSAMRTGTSFKMEVVFIFDVALLVQQL